MSGTRIAIFAFVVVNVVAFGLYFSGLRIGGAQTAQLYDEPPEGALRVLFIGNSHTSFYNVPAQVQHLGAAAGEPIWVEQVTEGGASLQRHWRQKTARKRIVDGDWDVVVLQERSLHPVLHPQNYLGNLRRFTELVRRSGARPVLYATWERARWHDIYKDGGDRRTPAMLRDALERSFHRAEERTGADVAPVGTAWLSFRRKHPGVPLHSEDGNHATRRGAYLAASVLYRVITDREVAGNDFALEGMRPEVIEAMQDLADRSPQMWQAKWETQKPAASPESSDSPPPGKTPAPTRKQPRSATEILEQKKQKAPPVE